MTTLRFEKIHDYLWEIPKSGGMQVPARIYASEKILRELQEDQAPQQAVNVAHLPGIVKYALAMPDIHWGYGFPIGGVAAFDLEEGVISPGGVGYDINCGVRLLASRLSYQEVEPHLERLIDVLFQRVPTGVGASGALKVSRQELRRVAVEGAHWAVRQGFGTASDLECIEENGRIEGADPAAVSERAYERGAEQLGTLGSGNHFLEVGYVAQIYDDAAAQAMGLFLGQVTVIIHTGSRGFGYQICDDYLAVMDRALAKYHIRLPDRQLACAPLRSPEGQQYLAAMRCGINFAFANRQIIAHNTRKAFAEALGMREEEIGLRTVYEVAHNIAKIEEHTVDGQRCQVCVHRKGATRAFPPGHPQIPAVYRSIGQPVLIPGDMGRYSYVLLGTAQAMEETFGSTCHGAGRQLSRTKAKKVAGSRRIADELRKQGIVVRGASLRTINEEIPEAYKDVAEVVEVCHRAGISRKVAQLRPLGCIKG
ncbi:RNA-splicing ligase RtcB [bacterium HR18]|nr:RNA-splicing ligase RtcB [bacterium HR18]